MGLDIHIQNKFSHSAFHTSASSRIHNVCPFVLQIIFYEERNFQGRSYDCSSDCADIDMHLSRCNSCRVENGCFVVYDRSNFMGNQLFLRRGEYSDVQRIGSMMGMTVMDSIRSCRMIPTVRHIQLHGLPPFIGPIFHQVH